MENTYLINYTKAMNEITKEVTDNAVTEAVNKMSEIIAEYKNELDIIKKDNAITQKNYEEIKLKLQKAIEEYEKLKNATYVLATDDGKRRELTRLIQKLTYSKFTKDKNTLEDKLFHKAITNSCYARLYNQFEVNTFTRIKIDDFDEAIKVIKRWFNNEQNIKRVINKKLQEYINDKHISKTKQNLVDEYLEKTNGGNNIAI